MSCKPRVVPKVISPPAEKLRCFNCGCKVKPGDCHCGARNWWAHDPWEGWYTRGSIPEVIVRGNPEKR